MDCSIGVQEDTAEYGANDSAETKGMQRVVDELMDKVGRGFRMAIFVWYNCFRCCCCCCCNWLSCPDWPTLEGIVFPRAFVFVNVKCTSFFCFNFLVLLNSLPRDDGNCGWAEANTDSDVETNAPMMILILSTDVRVIQGSPDIVSAM